MTTECKTAKMTVGFVGGNVAFYVVLIVNRWLVRDTNLKGVFLGIGKEFGFPELLDWLPIRPTMIVLCCWLAGSEALGTAWGHGAADVIFYALGFSNSSVKIASTVTSLLSRFRA